MIRVVIADDHALLREGLKRIIADFEGVEVVAAVSTGDEALRKCEEERPDVLLLDVSMPGRPFLETLSVLGTQLPHVRTLMLSMHPEDQYAVRALRAGAAGYLTKGQDPVVLEEAIRTVASGHTYVTDALAENLALRLGPDAPEVLHELLSDREFEVMLLLAQGKSNTDIGDDLALSPKTVSTYRARIFDKMGFTSLATLVRYTAESRLLE